MIKTKAYFEIKRLVESENLVVVTGPRRVGKTTIIRELVNEDESRVYVLADRLPKRDFKNGEELVNYLRFEGVLKEKHKQIFIDEAHYLTNLGIILKNIFDEGTYRVVITGSGSFKIYGNIGKELVGRKSTYCLYPFCFEDFLVAKGKNVSVGMISETKIYLEEFLEWGGYPEVVLAETKEKKHEAQFKIFSTYLDEDVKLLLDREEFFKFEEVLVYLAKNVGSLFVRDHIQRELGLSRTAMSRIKEVLEESYVTYVLAPFPLIKAGEIRKHEKVYFVDNGLLNFILRRKMLAVSGKLAENFVLSQLLKRKGQIADIFFWQRKNGGEIDFIWHDLVTGKITPMEVKSGKTTNIPVIFKTMEKYYGDKVEVYVVVNETESVSRKMGDREVKFVAMETV